VRGQVDDAGLGCLALEYILCGHAATERPAMKTVGNAPDFFFCPLEPYQRLLNVMM